MQRAAQIATLNLVGVKHLFVVPRLRTSSYIEMLASAAPGLANSAPGDIQAEALPTLRNLVVVDPPGEYSGELDKLGVRSAIDWREIMMWREDTRERDVQREISASLEKDDVINLQFTRYACWAVRDD